MSTRSDSTSRMLAGKCECRAVRYRVPDAFLYAANCHCSNCRGSAVWSGEESDDLIFRRGSAVPWSDGEEGWERAV
jgi:hypothetical protein